MNPIIVADSGGTSTDWCWMDQNGEKMIIKTESYHPIHWNIEFISSQTTFWEKHANVLDFDLHFYGAGCLSVDKAKEMESILKKIGFKNIHVQSDLHGAAKALFGSNDGVFGIMGTGSVFAEFKNGEIQNLKGGLGYILGDEGSAYYFGKLLLHALLNHELSDDLSNELFLLLGDKSKILSNVYGENSRQYIADLSKLTSNHTSEQLTMLHEKNITTFFDKVNPQNAFSLVGSYAFFQKDLIKQISIKRGLSLIEVLQFPIERLIDHHLLS